MATTEQRRKGEKGAARTEVVAVRFDPRTRFGLELAARAQRRSISNYIEWSVEQSFKTVNLETSSGQQESVDQALHALWNISEPVRLVRLKSVFPHLLTFDEQRLIELARLVSMQFGFQGGEQVESELIAPYWDMLKEHAALGTASDVVLAKVKELRDPPITVERIDKRIAELDAKHKKDIEWLKAKRKEVQATKA